jgi:hypothetical protein
LARRWCSNCCESSISSAGERCGLAGGCVLLTVRDLTGGCCIVIIFGSELFFQWRLVSAESLATRHAIRTQRDCPRYAVFLSRKSQPPPEIETRPPSQYAACFAKQWQWRRNNRFTRCFVCLWNIISVIAQSV